MSNEPVLLYVEDEALSRQVMQLLVERGLGFKHLTIFEDSDRFLSRLEALSPSPDVILLDIHMRPYDGFKILEMIRGHTGFCNIPVVAVTASVMEDEVDLLAQAGFNGGISKPIDQVFFGEFIYRILKGENVWHVT